MVLCRLCQIDSVEGLAYVSFENWILTLSVITKIC